MLNIGKPKNPKNKPPASPYKVRFVSLGGVIGVTKNMYVYELYEQDELKDILVIDCGIGFPREKELGLIL